MLIKVFLFDINREINKLNGVLQSLHSALADCQGVVFIVVFSLAASDNLLNRVTYGVICVSILLEYIHIALHQSHSPPR